MNAPVNRDFRRDLRYALARSAMAEDHATDPDVVYRRRIRAAVVMRVIEAEYVADCLDFTLWRAEATA